MKKEQIESIIGDYNYLIACTKNTISKLSKLDNSQYSTRRGVEDIKFYGDSVNVTCDDTCMGCYDQHSFEFPNEYLTMTDEQLLVAVNNEKTERIKKEELKLEREKREELERKLIQFERLKNELGK